MTDLYEIQYLVSKARRSGRTATLCFSEQGQLESVCYLDPKGGPRAQAGYITSPLGFVETERQKPDRGA